MPQFDTSSFLVQLIWLFISLIGFYLLLCLYFLPVTSQYIKARQSSNFIEDFFTYPTLEIGAYNVAKISWHKKVIF